MLQRMKKRNKLFKSYLTVSYGICDSFPRITKLFNNKKSILMHNFSSYYRVTCSNSILYVCIDFGNLPEFILSIQRVII